MKRKLSDNAKTSISIARQSTDECWLLKNIDDTIALGQALGNRAQDWKLLLLEGPLGVGKTSLVKGLAKSLGIIEAITSPTFALSQHYPKGRPPLVHLDLYRLEDPKAADELFLQEEEEANALGARMVVEWADRLSLYLPEAWQIKLSYQANDGGRISQLTLPLDD